MTEYMDVALPIGETHCVYRAWAGDTCVYVGVTSFLLRRIYEHRAGRGGSQSKRMKAVFEQVTRVDFAEFPDRESAELEESRQIRRLQPEGNRHRHLLPGGRWYPTPAQGSLL